MLNIVLVGFDVNDTNDMVNSKLREAFLRRGKAVDVVVTVMNSTNVPVVRLSSPSLTSPYVIVQDTDLGVANRLGAVINEELNVDVEIEVIAGFLPKH